MLRVEYGEENGARTMSMKVGQKSLYVSAFDVKTGTIIRSFDAPKDIYGNPRDRYFQQRYPQRHEVFSPVPETVDISITNKCSFGCSYCYQNSTGKDQHAPASLVEDVLIGFDSAPYQIAIGGGEPTEHPDFPYILRKARELGTVPNYTTNGARLIPEVVQATNDVCGGVAMTYHAFKGIDWFVEHYNALKEALKVQINVHLIFDDDVARNLIALAERCKEMRLVLLAYYPDVGRANFDGFPGKQTYQRDFPEALKRANQSGFSVAFSEGLLPYFLSRPALGINTDMAVRSEGKFSCYFNPKGQISHSSFSPAHEEAPAIYASSSQKLWENLNVWRAGHPDGGVCYDCKFAVAKCATPHEYHYLMCDFTPHNVRRTKPAPNPLKIVD